MTEKRVPRKWEYIADQLRKLNAPAKVVNAATEIDNAMVKLELGYNTKYWVNDLYHRTPPPSTQLLRLLSLVNNSDSCSACDETIAGCHTCKLGGKDGCTPRRNYADKHYSIVYNWITSKLCASIEDSYQYINIHHNKD